MRTDRPDPATDRLIGHCLSAIPTPAYRTRYSPQRVAEARRALFHPTLLTRRASPCSRRAAPRTERPRRIEVTVRATAVRDRTRRALPRFARGRFRRGVVGAR